MTERFLVEFETPGQAEAWLEMMQRGIHANARVSELETHEQDAFVRSNAPDYVVTGLTYWYTRRELYATEHLSETEQECMRKCKEWLHPTAKEKS